MLIAKNVVNNLAKKCNYYDMQIIGTTPYRYFT